ncbi:hepatocyte growth factor receptor-like [Dreissena polymorpha]|uniref:hepatocyte growth factor receptor-like n=1 Tax=Dreissena polymorpha TaxID=45954 RepID=UPI0022653129|nr:hepatocyte growth factor receptor-like [Dreissena polymorpha]
MDYVISGQIPTGDFTINETFEVELNDVDILPEFTFSFLENPEIKSIDPQRGFLSGGTILTVTGDNLRNAQHPRVFIQNYEAESSESCLAEVNSSNILYCKVPIAPAKIKSELQSRRNKRSAECLGCQEVQIVVKLDGIEKTFTLKYYYDPSLSKFTNGMQLFKADEQFLTVHGDNFNFLKNSDVTITIGIEQCRVVQIEPNSMECVAPRTQPKPGIQGAEYPEVNIFIGNINQTLGQLQYQKDDNHFVIIVGAVGGTVVFVGVLAFVLICLKYRKTRSKARELEGDLNKLEMEIKSVARQEGHDNVHYDVIPDDVTEREATSFTSLQVC